MITIAGVAALGHDKDLIDHLARHACARTGPSGRGLDLPWQKADETERALHLTVTRGILRLVADYYRAHPPTEADELLRLANETVDRQGCPDTGHTYAQGVLDTLRLLAGDPPDAARTADTVRRTLAYSQGADVPPGQS